MKRLIAATILMTFLAVPAMAGLRDSGFLPVYVNLAPHPSLQATEGLIWVDDGFAPAAYSRFIVDPVELWLPEGYDDVSVKDLQGLCRFFRDAVITAMSDRYQIVDEPAPGVARISSAITDVQPTAPVADVMSAVIPVGIVASWGKKAITGKGIGVGEASIEALISDSMTGQPLLMFQGRRVGGKYTDKKESKRLGDPEMVLNEWAEAVRRYFDIFHDIQEEKEKQ